jgi:hypothetical protein
MNCFHESIMSVTAVCNEWEFHAIFCFIVHSTVYEEIDERFSEAKCHENIRICEEGNLIHCRKLYDITHGSGLDYM